MPIIELIGKNALVVKRGNASKINKYTPVKADGPIKLSGSLVTESCGEISISLSINMMDSQFHFLLNTIETFELMEGIFSRMSLELKKELMEALESDQEFEDSLNFEDSQD